MTILGFFSLFILKDLETSSQFEFAEDFPLLMEYVLVWDLESNCNYTSTIPKSKVLYAFDFVHPLVQSIKWIFAISLKYMAFTPDCCQMRSQTAEILLILISAQVTFSATYITLIHLIHSGKKTHIQVLPISYWLASFCINLTKLFQHPRSLKTHFLESILLNFCLFCSRLFLVVEDTLDEYNKPFLVR